jgi:hypothetical protein
MTTTTIPADATAERRRIDKPRVPHTAFMRELTMADGRKLTIDRRSVAMLCEGKPEKFEGRKVTIVGFRIPGAAPVPVQEGYHDLKSWWRGDANGKAA